MKSKVTNLYDYKQESIPAHLLQWKVSEEEIDRQLALLARNDSILSERQKASVGDVVRCRVINAQGSWSRPVLLVYPGQKLCPPLEEACLGIQAKERRTAVVNGVTLDFEAERTAGLNPAPVDDALIRRERVPGVTTVEDYRSWWRNFEEARRRKEQSYRCAYYLLQRMTEQSSYQVDEQEMENIFSAEAAMQREAMEASGVPTELIECQEDITARFREKPEVFFYSKILHPYLVELLRTEPLESVMEKALESYAEINCLDPAIIRENYETYPSFREQITTQAALDLLRETYINAILEV